MDITLVIVVAALICTIISAIGRLPLWVAVLLLCLVHLLAGRV
jgi:hypothetical protein